MANDRTSEARIRTAVLTKEATESANRILAASEALISKSRSMLDAKARVPQVAREGSASRQ
jgi:hypothetical protein